MFTKSAFVVYGWGLFQARILSNDLFVSDNPVMKGHSHTFPALCGTRNECLRYPLENKPCEENSVYHLARLHHDKVKFVPNKTNETSLKNTLLVPIRFP